MPRAHGPIPCTRLPVGEPARITLVAAEPEVRTRLALLGIAPGSVMTVLQRWPATVVRVEETEIALEEAIAAAILVEAPR